MKYDEFKRRYQEHVNLMMSGRYVEADKILKELFNCEIE